MSPEDFQIVRNRLGLSQNDMAALFGLGSARTVRRWEEGEKDIPGPVLLLLELCLELPEVREYLELDNAKVD
jgi:DNA-binding transcriptional regulator YiaG